ncbi:MAG TPA: ferritin [Myxococcota bacterium]|nr:ferritin [Myxococcota bacterium]
MNEKMVKALNEQINNELYASYLYLSMSAWFETQNWPGFAKWMKIQSQEEYGHAMKIYDYLIERGQEVTLAAIAAPKTAWKKPIDAFKDAQAHEKKVTGNFQDLTDLAIKLKDHATQIYLQWFVSEQVEEEKNVDEVIQALTKIGDSTGALFMLDHRIGKREG